MRLPSRRTFPLSKLTRTALLFAVSAVLSIAESFLIPPGFLPPGIKLGLGNIPVLLAVTFLSWKEGAALAVMKALLALMTRGITAGMLSLSGGLLSVCIVWLLTRLGKRQVSCLMLGCAGSVAHGIGQLIGAAVLTSTPYVFLYLPVLTGGCLVTGALTGSLFYFIQPYLKAFEKKLEG